MKRARKRSVRSEPIRTKQQEEMPTQKPEKSAFFIASFPSASESEDRMLCRPIQNQLLELLFLVGRQRSKEFTQKTKKSFPNRSLPLIYLF